MPYRFNLADRCFYAGLAVTTVLLGLVLAGQGQWEAALGALAVGGAWGGAHFLARRRPVWRWVSPAAFTGQVLLAAGSLWHLAPATWLVVVAGAALVTWDLEGLAVRLAGYAAVPEEARLVGAHLRRQLLLAGAGIAFGEVALHVRLTLGLGLVAALGVLVAVLLTLAARQLGAQASGPPEEISGAQEKS